MRSRERNHDPEEHITPPAASGGAPDVRERGEHLLTIGDEAIRRGMSTDSTAFLAANKQEGGQ